MTLREITARIEKAASGRRVQLVAVSKTQPAEEIVKLIAEGQRAFGENRVQEAAEKWPALRALHPDIKLHLIGHLQTNKAAQAVALFDAIESIDSDRLADALASEMKKQARALPCFIQVNTGAEPQKGGVLLDGLDALHRHCLAVGLDIKGLMCIPPAGDLPAPHFALLHKRATALGLNELSMGMSADFETAIRLGATQVRIGAALFGARD
jgi:PLP dependent protein